MFLVDGRKPENLKETYKDWGRICESPHTSGLNQEPCCEAAMAQEMQF